MGILDKFKKRGTNWKTKNKVAFTTMAIDVVSAIHPDSEQFLSDNGLQDEMGKPLTMDKIYDDFRRRVPAHGGGSPNLRTVIGKPSDETLTEKMGAAVADFVIERFTPGKPVAPYKGATLAEVTALFDMEGANKGVINGLGLEIAMAHAFNTHFDEGSPATIEDISTFVPATTSKTPTGSAKDVADALEILSEFAGCAVTGPEITQAIGDVKRAKDIKDAFVAGSIGGEDDEVDVSKSLSDLVSLKSTIISNSDELNPDDIEETLLKKANNTDAKGEVIQAIAQKKKDSEYDKLPRFYDGIKGGYTKVPSLYNKMPDLDIDELKEDVAVEELASNAIHGIYSAAPEETREKMDPASTDDILTQIEESDDMEVEFGEFIKEIETKEEENKEE